MQVAEILHLADWFEKHFARLEQACQQMMHIIQHNAANPNSLTPVEESISGLESALKEMDRSQLSNAQESILRNLKVDGLIGLSDADQIERLVKPFVEDPSASGEFSELVNHLANARNTLVTLRAHFEVAGVRQRD